MSGSRGAALCGGIGLYIGGVIGCAATRCTGSEDDGGGDGDGDSAADEADGEAAAAAAEVNR